MKDFEQSLVESFKSYKLDRAAEDVLAELKKGNIKGTLNLANSAFRVVGGSSSGIPPIPAVISMLVNAYETLRGANDFYKLKKHVELFVRLDEIKEVDRLQFVEELDKDPNFREQFCATVYMLVDRVSELDKIRVLSNLIIARNERKIDNESFFRMMHIVDKLNWHELFGMYLSQCFSSEMIEFDQEKWRSLDRNYIELLMESNGLVEIKREIKENPNAQYTGKSGEYYLKKDKRLSHFGKQFLSSAFRGFKYKMHGGL